MPFNGSGSFTPPGADFPAVANTLIEAAKFNNVINDIATGLSTCITKDGQTTVTANIPFGGYRLTSVGAGVAASDAARVSQLQNGSGATLGTIAGTNAITAVASPVITAYAANQKFIFLPANTNSGATTINIDGLGAKNIYLNGAACTGGELVAGTPVEIFYDGTQFQIVATGATVTKTGTEILANKTLASPTLTGTVTGAIANWSGLGTFSAGIALSGTASNVTLGANYISYGGTDAGISLDASNNVTMSGGATIGGNTSVTGTLSSTGYAGIAGGGTTTALMELGGTMPAISSAAKEVHILHATDPILLLGKDDTNYSYFTHDVTNTRSRWVMRGGGVYAQLDNNGMAVTGTLSSTGNLTVSGTGTNSFSGNVGITKATGAPILSLVASTGTNEAYIALTNNSETAYVGKENSAGSWFGGTAYATVVQAPSGRVVQAIIAGTPKLTVSGSAVTVADNLTVSGTGTIAGHGTTASAANTYIDSSTGLISRSTSAMKYKRDAEPINPDVASKVLSLKPIWYRSNTELCVNDNPAHSWYGLGAEEVAAVDPRFVFFGYDAEDYEDVIIDERVEVPLMETEMVPFKRIEMRDGVPTLITGTEPVKTQKTQPVAVVDEAGNDVFEDQRIENEDGGVTVNRVQLFHDVPQFTTEIKTRTERRLKAGAVKRPQGVDYARLIVPLLPKLKVLLDP